MKIARNFYVHFIIYIIVCILCVVSTLVWQIMFYCPFNFRFVLALEVHSAPAFAIIYFCLIMITIIADSPTVSLCIIFDLIGFFLHFTVGILQIWIYEIQDDSLYYYRTEIKNNTVIYGPERICNLNYTFILNIIIALIIFIDMILFIFTDGSIEDAGERPHNFGDSMLDAFQDFHFWTKYVGFIFLFFSTVSLIIMPYQCKPEDRWFTILEMHAAPSFLIIFFCILVVYVFGEFPYSIFCLMIDILGAIIIGCVGLIYLIESIILIKSTKSQCAFSSTWVLDWIIFVILLLDAVIYIVVDLGLKVEDQRRDEDN